MNIYNYHPDTKIYIGSTIADESPLEPGVFMVPRNATEQQPPETGGNEIAQFDIDEDEWTVVTDYRGYVGYDESGNQVTIDEIGVAPEASWSETPPEAPTTQEKSQFTSLEYLDKFTEAEQIAIITATSTDVQVKMFYDRLLAATFIDLNDPRTAFGIDILISKELLAPSRKAELLEPEVIDLT